MKVGFWKRSGLFVFGVALPIYTLLFEAMTGMCASTFFDPIPTLLHVVLIALVPLSQFLVARDLKREGEQPRTLPQLLLGAGILVSVVYTGLFLTVMPVVATYLAMSIFVVVVAVWLLVLPFAPLLSGISGILYAMRSSARWPEAQRRLRWNRYAGAVSAALLLVVAEGPRTVSRWGLVTLERESERTDVISWMRTFADEQLLLRAAYGEVTPEADFLGWVGSFDRGFSAFDRGGVRVIDSGRAREVFYRVTGKPFNSVPRPSVRRFSMLFGGSDADVGGERVGGIADGVRMVSSTIDGTIDADALTSYTEWTLVFENSEVEQAEARAEIRLPVDGVISRATLWVNGEEREAAIGGRAEVRAAYQKVVSFRRDPLLVTTSGRDRALIQCFPIPPNGGQMKIRIGVTAPLSLKSMEEAQLMLPYLVERNFALGEQSQHSVWYESRQRLESAAPALATEQLSERQFAVRGAIPARSSGGEVIRASRSAGQSVSWSEELRSGGTTRVVQRIDARMDKAARHLVLLVDGSVGLRSERARLADAIKALPSGTSVGVIVAGDSVLRLTDAPRPANTERLRELAHEVRDYDYAGGADNARGLAAAWDMATAHSDSVIVWLHGSQPVRFASIEELAQRARRRPNGPKVVSVELVPGSDRISTESGVESLFVAVPAEQLGGGDLGLLLQGLLTAQQRLVPVRELQSVSEPIEAPKTSDHLARLWAASEITRLIAKGKDEAARAEALLLATDYRLVTAISGAVVLETDQQYRESGLEPPSPTAKHPGILPVAPEPEFYLMLLLLVPCAAVFIRGRGAVLR